MDRLWSGFVLMVLFCPSGVSAHASLVKSVPARRAQLFNPPPKVQLWFNERLEARFCHLTVTDATKNRVDLGNVQVAPDDSKQLSVGIGPLKPGLYIIRFRVLSVDGHVVEDEFPFTIRELQRTP
jgi:methionine-rich copper-binding protein CopC